MAEAWNTLRPDWLVWTATRKWVLDNNTLARFAIWCARQVWEHLTDERSKNAIIAAEQYLDGKVNRELLMLLLQDAHDANVAVHAHAYAVHAHAYAVHAHAYAVHAYAYAAAADAAVDAAAYAADDVADTAYAAYAAARAAARADVTDANITDADAAQAEWLRKNVKCPFEE